MINRVVITGIGCITPLGCNISSTWNNLINGKSGIRNIDTFDTTDLSVKIAGLLPNDFNPDLYLEPKEQKKFDKFVLYAIAAATQAFNDAKWKGLNEEAKTVVIIGSGIGGLQKIYDTSISLSEYGPRRGVSPFFIPSVICNMASGMVAIKLGLKGSNFCITSACSSGAHAIGEAFKRIKHGISDYALVGGTENVVCKLGIAGFAAAKALSSNYNNNPTEASRPWDKKRDGFVMGEGAAILALETLESAKARGAHIYAEILGYNANCDAYHITAPEPSGESIYECMKGAINDANINPSDIDYINAHGTSTVLGDLVELNSVEKLMKNSKSSVLMSSTKSSTGHLLGAAGAVEAIFSILALQDGVIPPTINLNEPEPTEYVELVGLKHIKKEINIVMSNSFGFGGTNASLIFKKV